jgi:hypothetical protein
LIQIFIFLAFLAQQNDIKLQKMECNIMPLDAETSIYDQILKQIKIADLKIKEIKEEKLALERLLLKLRRGDSLIKDVSRRDSINRIILEDIVLDIIKNSNKPVKSKTLYDELIKKFPELNKSTFRSHIRRMSLKFLIKKSIGNKGWEI